MTQKTFFKKKTPQEIQDSYKFERVFTQRNLVARISDLNPTTNAIELRSPLIPGNILFSAGSDTEASRKHYRHGQYLPVKQPKSQQEAFAYPYIPLVARMQALEGALKDMKEEDIMFLGLSWFPVQGKDRRARRVPFDVTISGVKLYDYAVHRAGKIGIDDRYVTSATVSEEGGHIFCKVPSRTKRKERYGLHLYAVPLVATNERKAIIWSLKSSYEEGKEPMRTTYFHDLRYEKSPAMRSPDVFTFGPHEVAAYLAIIKQYWHGKENTVPLEMNPFPLPSKSFATDYAHRLDNNVLIVDSKTKKLRGLHLDEKCILLARAIKVKGSWETVFWDESRDGAIKDYWE